MTTTNMMDVTITTLPTMKVVYMRHVGPYTESGPTWEKLISWARENNALTPDTIMLGLSYDDPQDTPPEKLRYDACISIPNTFNPPGSDVKTQTLLTNNYATTTYQGSYSNLEKIWYQLFEEWLPQSGYTYNADPCLEIYRNSPYDTPEEELVTELYLPLD